MTRQQNIDKILAAIDKVCPERKELTFGCEVKCRVGNSNSVFNIEKYIGEPIFVLQDGEKDYFRNHLEMHIPKDAIVDILGHPPTLAMVLVALEYNTRVYWTTELLAHRPHSWNLHKDSLYDQSDETVAFIASLFPNA